MSYFECFSATVSTIYCFNPELRLCFVRNWVLLYINENENRMLLREDISPLFKPKKQEKIQCYD